MKRRSKYIALVLFLGIAIFVSSCKTSRQTQQIALTTHTMEERVGLILNQALPYKTFSGNLRFGIKPGLNHGNMTTDAQLKIIKNEMIQLSLRIPILGTEAARINISPEQMIIIDRINKMYFAESMENLKKHFPFDFDFYSVQSLFTNQLFVAGKQQLTPDDYISFDYREDEFSATLNQKDSRGIIYDFTSDYSHRILKTEIYKSNKDVDMNWDYSDFGRTSGNRLFPMKMNMTLTIPDDLISMNLNFSNVDIDASFELKADIPQKYKQIDLNQAIKLIQSF
jgi:hypothetical protein